MAASEHGIGCLGKALAILLILTPLSVNSTGQEEGSLFEFAQSLLQESVRNQNAGSGLSLLSGVVQGLMQSDGGKQLGDMLTKGGSGGAIDLITNLASVWQGSKFRSGQNSDSGSTQELGIDPSVISSMVDLFSTFNKISSQAENNNVDENNNDKNEVRQEKRKPQEEAPINWDAILSLAGTLLSSVSNQGSSGTQNEQGGLESFLSFLPVLMNSINGQHNYHSSNSIPHHAHSQYLPPFLENLHEYWDYFLTTDYGKGLWKNSGLSDLVKDFTDDNGHLEVDKVFESLENNAFRRRWIKSLSAFVAQWLKHFTNPDVQKSYLETGQVICNSFLKAQGFPKESLLDLKKPAKSISALTNAIFKKHFDLDIQTGNYVEPAVNYVQELFKVGHKTGLGFFKASSGDLETKLSETMDREVIDPILRVNRAYRFALKRPACAKYVVCAVNQNEENVKSGLKPAITKASSLAASWFLSGNDTSLFWNLYTASGEENSCTKYSQNCKEFDAEDIKATTEYYHNEL